ncbi:MAG: phosphoribosylaminoimidazolesuccinocarboxamide synthase [Phycisphaerales bacterium]|nr:phosphoribosylaminoimidazolesuccinocarboxamide synthase [Phycisphaerales bacterium]
MNAKSSSRTSSDSGLTTFETDLKLEGSRRGKVRDVYTMPGNLLSERLAGHDGSPAMVMIASDRISAFDVVLPTAIPGKGRLLTSIATFWLEWIEQEGICKTHLISTDDTLIPDSALTKSTQRGNLVGRTTIGRMCKVIPVECVVRGYLEGSGLKDYRATGSVCGVALPDGLQQCDQLPEPIFTPATKADEGHDENIGFEEASAAVEELGGSSLMARLKELSIEIYSRASRHAAARGIILADTKFEFGIPINAEGHIIGQDPILIDEALTPDSSRFWPADLYEPGRAQQSFDKQFVREYLERLVQSRQWDKTPPGPELPDEVVQGTLKRYSEALDLLIS